MNFGNVRDWNSPPASFTFTNTSNERLMFLPQRHERDVLVRYPNRAIRPGETATLSILYYTGETGPFSRTVEVYSNASNRAEKLTIKGNIKSIYADALTSCPSFQSSPVPKQGEPNVVQVVDALTDRPIPGAQVEILDRGIRKAINGTNLEGVAVNWIEPGNYVVVASKEGYERGENEASFTKRDRTHIIYLKRTSERIEEPEIVVAKQNDPTEQELIQTEAEDGVDLGISLNEQLEELQEPESSEIFDLGIAMNEQWEEPIIESEQESRADEAADLGISVNQQLAEDPITETRVPEQKSVVEPVAEDLGITTNEAFEEKDSAPVQEESNIEEMVEAALAESEKNVTEEKLTQEVLQEPEFSSERYKPNNVLLLLDVSGSMNDDGKMDKLKSSIRRLVMMLREQDVLTMIAYNSTSWEVLPPTPVAENERIVALVDSLKAYGYTNGVKGMESAYASLESQLIADGNNQLIIATDGKFNSSKFSEQEAVQLVKNNSDKGIVLSIIGFGDDREANRLMKRLANLGEGSFLQVSSGQDPTELLADEIKLRSRKE